MNKHIMILKSSIVGFTALLLVSCTDLLDMNPKDQISSATFWKNQADADMALAGVYSNLWLNTFNYYQMYWDVLGGDLWGATASGGTNPNSILAMGQIYATSGGIVSSIYSDCYKGIAVCNFFLDNIDNTPITDAIKEKYKGEVLFLRAFFYFTLTDFYGGVPLFTKPPTIDGAKVKQSPKEDVLNQIQADLDAAIASLPNTDYSVTGKGHAVKGTALALKAKVCLFQQDWAGAVAATSQIMSDGQFNLCNNYSTMFLTVGQANNPEIIFSTRYLAPDYAQPRYYQAEVQFIKDALINPRNELVDEFECIDGLPITSSPLYDGSTDSSRKMNRDPRLSLSIKTYAEAYIKSSGEEVIYNPTTTCETGWEPIKTLNADLIPVDMSTVCDEDWVLLRYAEVLLMYAEAKNEFSGPDQSIYDAINAVRARPGINMPPISTGLTKDQMRTRIQHEKRVEFCMEGKRYSDMKRWKLAETYFPTLKSPTGVQYVFNPSKNYVFPFPQSEIDINPNLVQNPGY